MEIIKYTDQMGNEVGEEQRYALEHFFKTYYKDGKPVKCEIYKQGKFLRHIYHVRTEDEIRSILVAEPTVSFEYEYYQNNCRIRESRSYENGIVTPSWFSVYDNTGNYICSAQFEADKGELKPLRIEKYYYENGERKYEFNYNKDGSCFIIYDMQEYQSDIYAWSIGEPHIKFTWDGFEYYRTAEPIIPEK